MQNPKEIFASVGKEFLLLLLHTNYGEEKAQAEQQLLEEFGGKLKKLSYKNQYKLLCSFAKTTYYTDTAFVASKGEPDILILMMI